MNKRTQPQTVGVRHENTAAAVSLDDTSPFAERDRACGVGCAHRPGVRSPHFDAEVRSRADGAQFAVAAEAAAPSIRAGDRPLHQCRLGRIHVLHESVTHRKVIPVAAERSPLVAASALPAIDIHRPRAIDPPDLRASARDRDARPVRMEGHAPDRIDTGFDPCLFFPCRHRDQLHNRRLVACDREPFPVVTGHAATAEREAY